MLFQATSTKDPDLGVEMDELWTGRYDLTSRSRIRGLGADGISFLNTSDTQLAEGFLGAALLALRTTGMKDVEISWTGGTVTPNSRPYSLRLQWRAGTNGPFADALGPNDQPVEYVRHDQAGHSLPLGPVRLPPSAGNRPVIQVRWKYCATADAATGARAELRLDDIRVTAVPGLEVIPDPFTITTTLAGDQWRIQAHVTPGALFSLHTSSDLVHWELVRSRSVGVDGLLSFEFPVDEAATRFFQVRSP
jgi:hypothetical protein